MAQHNYLRRIPVDCSSEIKPFVDWMLHTEHRSLHTVDAYGNVIQQFAGFLGHYHEKKPSLRLIQGASLTDVRAFLSMRAAKSITNRSNAAALSALKTYYRFLKGVGVVVSIPLHTLRSPRIPRKMPRPLGADQAIAMMNRVPENNHWVDWRNHSMDILLYATGLRIHEALSLNVRQWHCPDTLYVMGKGGKERMIPLLKKAFDAVEQYRHLCPYTRCHPDDPLFLGQRGKRLQAAIYQKYFRTMRQVFNLPPNATPHSLRHSFASHLLDRNASLRDVQELLGHASLQSTQHYMASSQKHLQDVYQACHPDGGDECDTGL